VRHSEHALRRWARLTVVRVAYYMVVAIVALAVSSTPIAVVAVLSGLSAQSFQPVQLAVLYGCLIAAALFRSVRRAESAEPLALNAGPAAAGRNVEYGSCGS